jgi:hypothetical protein
LGESHGIRGGGQWQYRHQWNEDWRSSSVAGAGMAEQGEKIHLGHRTNLCNNGELKHRGRVLKIGRPVDRIGAARQRRVARRTSLQFPHISRGTRRIDLENLRH